MQHLHLSSALACVQLLSEGIHGSVVLEEEFKQYRRHRTALKGRMNLHLLLDKQLMPRSINGQPVGSTGGAYICREMVQLYHFQ